MIAVSSYAPVDRALEIARNQITALASWELVFSRIFYFGAPVPSLAGPTVTFLPSKERPTIKEMASFAGGQSDWAALVNADIVVKPRTATFAGLMTRAGMSCGISRRLEFDPDVGPVDGTVVDWGLDFFLASPAVWQQVARAIPEQFLVGKQLWDTWLLGFWATHQRGGLVDLSPARLIWHPKHENRGDFAMEIPPNDPYVHRATWPRRRIAF